jgi:hypothetical protein
MLLDPLCSAPPEPYKTQVLKALMAIYTVWCDNDYLKIRPKRELCGEPHSISWGEAMQLTGVGLKKPMGIECNAYTTKDKIS